VAAAQEMARAASSALVRRRRRDWRWRANSVEATVDIEEAATPESAHQGVRDIVGGFGADLVMDCSGHRAPARKALKCCADGGTYVEMGQFTDAGSIMTSWHRICTKDLTFSDHGFQPATICRSAVDMLYRTRHKYPWLEMQTLYPFSEEGISRAVPTRWR